MAFNTAMFYDIENLLKGYSFSQQLITNLSLGEIVKAVKRTDRLGQIAVQRAYANWSDPRLAIMRGEINDLGIDPIQVFGFSRDQKKNAADIQLAIDAIDLAHVRPAIEVYVIVSGDGGFASLAKKLHEYGKTVIGCAYRNATNRSFQAVCDAFVWIADPDEEDRSDRQERLAVSPANIDPTDAQDPRNVRVLAKIKKCRSSAHEDALAKVKELLMGYASDSGCRDELSRSGIFLSAIQEGVKAVVPGLQPIRSGFVKFIEYLQFACKDTPLCVVRPSNSQAVLLLRDCVKNGLEVLPDLEQRDLQTPEGYRLLLATGTPILRFPPFADMQAIVQWIAQNPPEQVELGVIIESTTNGLNGAVSTESVRQGVLSLVSSDAFERIPEGVTLSEQKLTLHHDVRAPNTLLAMLRHTARAKLLELLGTVQDETLAQVMGEATTFVTEEPGLPRE